MDIAKKIRMQSRDILKGNWASALTALFVLLLFAFVGFGIMALLSCLFTVIRINDLLTVSITFFSVLASLIFLSPAINGYLNFHYKLTVAKEPDISVIFNFFKNGRYFRTIALNIALFFRSLLPLQFIGIILFVVLFIQQNNTLIKTLDAFLIVLNFLYILTELARISVTQFLYIDNPDEELGYYFKIAKTINKYHYHNSMKLTISFIPWVAFCYFVLPGFYVIPYFTTSLATSAKWLIKLYKDGKIV